MTSESESVLPATGSGLSVAGRLARQRWWAMRLAALPVHVLLFATASFFLIRLMPGNPVLNITGGRATPAQVAQVRRQLGLDGSIVTQYCRYLAQLLHGNLGESFTTHHAVFSDIIGLFPATLELALLASAFMAVIALAAATLIVLRPRNFVSRVLSGYASSAGAVPDFVLGVVAIFLFYATLHWAPAPTGLLDPQYNTPPVVTHFPLVDAILTGDPDIVMSELAHLALPVTVLAVAIAPLLIRQLVSAMSRAVDAPATRFRIASGVRRRTVLASILRHSLPPAVTLFGIVFGALIGGAVIVEQLFGFPGIGQYAVSAVGANDYPALQGVLTVAAALSLTVFFLVDIANMLLDPRRRPGTREEAAS